ncbi:MAG: hypothetical protein OEO79_07510 [Gemmatimonadota bacterium]|nr:hypothetical protein [Gemmatimonadota bacterium]MDH3422307.1 hypothetical protein [Gemmatimonadota bacterium]
MRATAIGACLYACVAAAPLAAQGSDAGDGFRVGISVGGISTVGVSVELFRDTHAIELGLGTWSFRDVSISTVYKEYIGGKALRPFVGAGLWTVIAAPALEEERTGLALVLRVPVGVDWSFVDNHAIGLALNLNRGLAVRRSDPEDVLPMNRRLVPLPEAYYRLTP